MNLKINIFHFLFLMLILCQPATLFAAKAPVVSGLLCEYIACPLGIDVSNPRLSWQIQTDDRNLTQTAYEIRVALSRELLQQKSKLVWNSGKVISDQSVNIEYQGIQLESRTRYCWQVRVWNSNQKVTDWSEPAWFETGLFDSALWKAKWISATGKTFDDHRPIYFRKAFDSKQKIKSARLYISAHGLYEVSLNGKKVSSDLFTPGWTSYNKRLQYQTYDISSLLETENVLGAIVGDGWFRGNIGGKVQQNYFGDQSALIAQIEITCTDGTKTQIISDDTWQTADGAILESDIYNGEVYDAQLEIQGWDRPGFAPESFVQAAILNQPTNILIASSSYPVRAITEIVPQKIIMTPRGETVFDMGQNMVGWVELFVKGKKGDKVQ